MGNAEEQFDRDLQALIERQRRRYAGFDQRVNWRIMGFENTLRAEDALAVPPPERLTFRQVLNGVEWSWTPTDEELHRLEAVKFFVKKGVLSDFEYTGQGLVQLRKDEPEV